jgi:hypothetical protein
MAGKFEDILNECIDRLLTGESVEQCLQDYPEQAEELEPLLRVALATRKASEEVQPRPEFKAQVRQSIQSALQAQEQKPKKLPFFGWQPRWAVTALASLLIFFIAGGSIVAASGNSLPGDTLYSVKLEVEDVRMAFTFSDVGKAKLEMNFANRRIEELARMVEKNKPDPEIQQATIDVAPRFITSLENVKRLAEAQQIDNEDNDHLVELREALQQKAGESQEMLQEIENKAPQRVAAVIIVFADNSRAYYKNALEAAGVPQEDIDKITGLEPDRDTDSLTTDLNSKQTQSSDSLTASAYSKETYSSSLDDSMGAYMTEAACMAPDVVKSQPCAGL